jgi:hypothetical protein
METFEFWAREWPVITQAPHIVLGGLFAALVAAWTVTKWHYSSRLGSLTERIELLKEKLIDAQTFIAQLNDQIESNEQHSVLLRSSNYTVDAFENVVSATNRLGVTLASSRPWTKQSSANPLIRLNWRQKAPGVWTASSSWPNVGFRVEMESSNSFVLLGYKSCLGHFGSLDDAQRHAEECRYQMLIDEPVPTSSERKARITN